MRWVGYRVGYANANDGDGREVNGSRGRVVVAEVNCKAGTGDGMVINLFQLAAGAYRVLAAGEICGMRLVGCVYMTRRRAEYARGRDKTGVKQSQCFQLRRRMLRGLQTARRESVSSDGVGGRSVPPTQPFPAIANQPRLDSLALSLKEAPSTDVIRSMCTLPCLPCLASQHFPCRCYRSSTLHLHLPMSHSLPNTARLHLATQANAIACHLPS